MTNQFLVKVLVVDDELDIAPMGGESIRTRLLALAGVDGRFTLTLATSLKEVRAAVQSEFFHLVIADHDLKPGYGVEVLQYVARTRPSCRRLLVTRFPEFSRDGSDQLFSSLLPPDPTAQGFAVQHLMGYERLIKSELAHLAKPSLRLIALEAGRSTAIDDKHPLVSGIRMRIGWSLQKSEVDFTISEFHHLMQLLIHRPPIIPPNDSRDVQSADTRWYLPEDLIGTVEMQLLTGGRSSATVLKCSPVTSGGHRGSTSVVKIGPRTESEQEMIRYNQFVRFYRSTARRVELLSAASADTVGGMCYSFAGGGVDSVDTLENLFQGQDFRAIQYLEEEFSLGNREWYRQVQHPLEPDALVEFFEITHEMRVAELLRQAAELVSGLNSTRTCLGVPALASLLRGMRHHTCIVHGDLNSGNLLLAMNHTEKPVSFGDVAALDNWLRARQLRWNSVRPSLTELPHRSIMIDYRQTCRGPVFVDFAALQTSLRLLPVEIDLPDADIFSRLQREWQAWDLLWKKPISELPDLSTAKALGPEFLFSLEIGRLARLNFEAGPQMEHGGIEHKAAEREYAATCLLYALRIFKVKRVGLDLVPSPDGAGFKDLRRQAKLRLAVWIRQLSEVLS